MNECNHAKFQMLFVILKAACCTVDLHTCTLTTECRVVALFIRSHQNSYGTQGIICTSIYLVVVSKVTL